MSDRHTWAASGRVLVDGTAEGIALVLEETLSFWGGVDPDSGLVIDQRHPQHGADISGRVLVMPAGRGSSSSSSVLAEAVRARHGPSAIVLARTDEIVALGALVIRLLDGLTLPVVVLVGPDYGRVRSGDHAAIERGGLIRVTRPPIPPPGGSPQP